MLDLTIEWKNLRALKTVFFGVNVHTKKICPKPYVEFGSWGACRSVLFTMSKRQNIECISSVQINRALTHLEQSLDKKI